MAERAKILKCEICGAMARLLVDSGKLICCGQPMNVVEELTAEMANEKHVPVIEEIDGGYKVVVGSTLHPMLEAHYIQWIELTTDKGVQVKYLLPGEAPEAVFLTDGKALSAREYCNLHSLWINEVK